MKKWIALIMVLAMIVTLAACGEKDTPPAEDTPPAGSSAQTDQTEPAADEPEAPANDTGGGAMNALIQWMIDGKYSYDFEMTTEGGGQTMSSAGSMAIDGNNMAVTSTTEAEGQTVSSRTIIKEDAMYVIDDANKMIIKMQSGIDLSEMMGSMVADYSGIEKIGEGTGEINGRTLPYEEYTSEGVSIKYYMDGGEVYATESEYEGYRTVMIITNASNSVPAGAFDLPTGYTEM